MKVHDEYQNRANTGIGLAHVRPAVDRALLDGCLGAYVSVVAIAQDDVGYRDRVRSSLGEMGFHVLEFEDVEPLEARVQYGAPERELLDLVDALTPEQPVGVGSFDAYEQA